MAKKTYIDENGYLRTTEVHSNLLHRKIAYKHLYQKNRDKYPLPFSEYQVHHIDENKRNNKVSNLQIVTREEHEAIHGIGINTPDGLNISGFLFFIMIVVLVVYLILHNNLLNEPGGIPVIDETRSNPRVQEIPPMSKDLAKELCNNLVCPEWISSNELYVKVDPTIIPNTGFIDCACLSIDQTNKNAIGKTKKGRIDFKEGVDNAKRIS